jgi:hypothetical protein
MCDIRGELLRMIVPDQKNRLDQQIVYHYLGVLIGYFSECAHLESPEDYTLRISFMIAADFQASYEVIVRMDGAVA